MPTIISFLLLSLVSPGAAQPEAPPVPLACVKFSEPFMLAAQVREGRTEEQTLSLFQGMRSQKPTQDELFAEEAMIAAIHLAYRHPDLSAEEIQRRVQQACTVSTDGKILFDGF